MPLICDSNIMIGMVGLGFDETEPSAWRTINTFLDFMNYNENFFSALDEEEYYLSSCKMGFGGRITAYFHNNFNSNYGVELRAKELEMGVSIIGRSSSPFVKVGYDRRTDGVSKNYKYGEKLLWPATQL